MSQSTLDPATIKAAVQEHYGSRISAAASCCGSADSSCCESSTELLLHGSEALATLPEGVVTASYGCGNPLALASLKPGEVVLDLGSGGGLEVLLAAQRVGAAGYVYGLDMTDAMLEVARRNAEKVGASNVAFLKGDIERIPLPEQSVDVIISNCVINLVPDKGQVLNDAFRALKPGGRLAVSDIVFDGELSDLPFDEAQLRGALSWSACFAGALTMEDYRRLLAAAGFEQIGLEVTRRYTIAELREEGSEMLAGLPAEAVQLLEGKVTSCAITAWKPA
jgi:arsenite methyltransferase